MAPVPRSKHTGPLLAILLSLVYVVAFPEVVTLFRDDAFILAAIPALVAALCWGFWTGLATWGLLVPATLSMFVIRGIPFAYEHPSPYSLNELGTAFVVTLVVTYLADLRREYGRKLDEAQRQATELRLSRARLQSSLDSSDQAIVLIDAERRVVAFNAMSARTAHAMTGAYPEAGMPYTDFVDAATERVITRLFDEAMTGHTAINQRHDVETSEQTRQFRLTCYPVVTDDGNIEGVCLYALDITENVRTHEQSSREISGLNTIIEALPVPVFYKGLDGRYAGCNSLYAELLGKSRDEVVGRTLGEIVDDPEADTYRQTDIDLLSTGGTHVYEGPAAFGPGKGHRHIILAKSAYTDDTGAVAGIVGTITDITERRTAEEALKQSEAVFRHVFHRSPLGAVIVDLDHRVIQVNRQMCNITGYDEHELLAMSLDRLVHPDDIEHVLTGYGALRDGEVDDVTADSRYLRKDGAIVWVRRSLRLLQSDDGRPLHYIVLVQDISNERAAQEALRKSEECYRLLVENQTDMVTKTDAEGTILFVSPNYCKTFGLAEQELIGKSFLPMVHEADRSHTMERMKDLFRPPHECYYEQRSHTHDGLRWFAWACKAVVNDDGEVKEIVGVGRDITEHKGTRDALAASEQRYHAVFESARDAIFLMKDGAFVDCNDEGCLLFEADREQIVGSPPHQFSPDRQADGRPSVAAALGFIQAATRGDAQFFDWRHQTTDGKIKDTEVSLARMEVNDEPHLLAVVRDVTDRKRAERELRESQRMLQTLMSNLPGMAYRCRNDKDWTMEFVSDGCRDLTGYEESELAGPDAIPYNELIHPDDRDFVWSDIQQAVEMHRAFELEYRIRTKDDVCRWVWEQGRAIYDDDGEPLVLEGLIIDITRQKHAELQLRLSDEILRQMPDAVVVSDADGHITHWLGGAEAMFAYTSGEAIGQLHDMVATPQSSERLRESARTALRQTGALHTEIVCRRKDGMEFPVDMTIKALTDEHGWTIAHIGVLRNITERRAAEDLLRESEQKFRLLFETAPLGMISFTSGGEILDINHTLLAILNLPSREHAQQLNLATLPRLGGTGFVDDVRRSLRTGKPLVNESSCRFEWGGSMYIRYLLTPIRDDSGTLRGLQAMIEDITDRVLGEQELRKLSAAVNQSANAICITDTHGIIEYTNPRFSEVTGYSVLELVGRPVSLLKSGTHDQEYYGDLWATISSGQVWSGVMQNRRKNGELYWERKSISPVFSDDGRIMNYLSTSEDITLELLTQAKLSESEKMAAVGMLAAGVAHEFKNYLGGIIGNASFALEELPEEDQLARETLENIVQMGEKANQVAMSLLTYSKARPEDRSREDLRTIIRSTISLVEKELRIRSIEIVTYFQDVPEVVVAAGKIQQLLLNLIINAEHAISSSGVIAIALVQDGDYVYLKVGDTGSGIAPEHLHKVFDPFYSTKGAWGKDKLVGTGMGLSICRNIAREHGGDLTVQTRVGVGTTFTLTLPLAEGVAEAERIDLSHSASPRMLVFSLDKTIMKDYFEDACSAGIELMIADNVATIADDVSAIADVAVCDARFSGKVELLMFVVKCVSSGVPFVTINCGAMEYQLSDIYERSAANFADLPPFERILERLGLRQRPVVRS